MDTELEKIQQGYDNLLGAVERGEIDVNTALSSLANMTAIDSTGSEWMLDPAGNWLRGFPGEAKVPANPDFFVSTAGRQQTFSKRNEVNQQNQAIHQQFSTPEQPSYDFMSNIEQYNDSKTQPFVTSQGEHVEPTLSFIKKLLGSKMKENKVKIARPTRKPVVIFLCLLLIAFALFSTKQSTQVTPSKEGVSTEVQEKPLDLNSEKLNSDTVDRVFINELKAGRVESFTFPNSPEMALLLGLAKLDPQFTVSSTTRANNKVKLVLIFKLEQTIEDVRINLSAKAGEWVVSF